MLIDFETMSTVAHLTHEYFLILRKILNRSNLLNMYVYIIDRYKQ